jgi:hypothetical protein
MLMKKTVFPSLRAAIMTLGTMALAPYTNKLGEEVDDTELEYSNVVAEYRVKEDDREFSVIVLWGIADYFFLYDLDPDNLVMVDGLHNDDQSHQKLSDNILEVLQRCMLVGYVPKTLLKAIHDYGRGGPHGDFENVFGELLDYVEDVLEGLEHH